MANTYTFTSPMNAALKPPSRVLPDFDDPFSLRPYWNVTAALGIIATTFFLILRIYTKLFIVKKTRWEDYTCVFGFVFFIAWIALNFVCMKANAGAHQWNLTSEQVAYQKKYYNYSDIIYSPAVGFTKLSILFLVLRVFCPQKRDPFYWVLQTLNVLNTIFYTMWIFIAIFLCSPREKTWLPETQGESAVHSWWESQSLTPWTGKCLQIFAWYISSTVFNIVSDTAMYMIPLWKIWHLQMSKARKLGMSAIFATGSLAIASSIARLIFVVILSRTQDYSYVKVQVINFTLSELAFGLICSCLFVLPRLYRYLSSSPPFKSEEYKLRKYKTLAESPNAPLKMSQFGVLQHQEEQRNPWERDIEIPAAAQYVLGDGTKS